MKIKSLILVSVLFLGGCAPRLTHVTNTPTGVTEQQVMNWYSAVGTVTATSDITVKLHQAWTNVHAMPIGITDDVYVKGLQVLGKMDQLNIQTAQFLQTVPKDWSVSTQQRMQDYGNQILSQIELLNTNGVTNIKNPQSLATINGFIEDAKAGINLLFTLITSVKTSANFQGDEEFYLVLVK